MDNANLPTLYINREVALPDIDQWEHRFEIRSSSSNRIYTVSQNKKHRHWACSCPGWKAHRKCKHLTAMGLPNNSVPHEVNVIKQ